MPPVGSWSIPFWATAGALVAAILYTRGWLALRALRNSLLPRWRLGCWLLGLAALWLAIASPLDGLANFLLTAHMIQHLLLMVLAPPLLLLASPQNPLLRGLPVWAARDAVGPFLRWPALRRIGREVTHPAVCWTVAVVALLGWHVPAAYDLALTSRGWHDLEHAVLFGTSLLFWWPVILPWPSTPHWPRWAIPAYLLAADLVTTALAAILCFSDRPLYRAYVTAPRLFGWDPLNDQAAAGAIMWVFGSLVLLSAAVVITVNLLVAPPILSAVNVSGIRSVSRFDLLRAPVVGPLLRSRYGRRALQATLLLVAVAVIADGFLGHQMGAMNLAGVLPWTYARALVVVALLAAGNLFCMACPFTLPREAGRRLGLATRHWPRRLRSKWLAAGLLALFFWAYEVFDLWDSPYLTAWIVTAYFVTALAVDTFFRGASFCKYVCPIGQFNFVGSLLSPLEVTVRRRDTCTACASHDCLRGNETQRGCELQLFLPKKQGNMDCTFCLDCVKACPEDNVGIVARREGVRLPSGRLDMAALALVVVFSAFVNAASMVGSAARVPGGGVLLMVAVIAAPMLLVREKSARELLCRCSLALVPLGLAMWTAHLLFHLSTAWHSGWPVLQRVTGWFGRPDWRAAESLLAADTLLGVQILLLDAGILLSLYLVWRVVRGRSMWLLLPGAVIAVGLWVAGVWIFLQPMQMRGMVHG